MNSFYSYSNLIRWVGTFICLFIDDDTKAWRGSVAFAQAQLRGVGIVGGSAGRLALCNHQLVYVTFTEHPPCAARHKDHRGLFTAAQSLGEGASCGAA